ncbi:hypothetical protein Efla_005281 [Eimeria flavescens]
MDLCGPTLVVRPRRAPDPSQVPDSTPEPLQTPFSSEYSVLLRHSIRCAARTEPIHINEEPQYRIRRPAQRQSDDPGALRASQLEDPHYDVAETDTVLRASFEESLQSQEEDRHHVLGT